VKKIMRRLISRPAFIPALLGTLLFLELLTARVALTADPDFVYLLGHRLNLVCATRAKFGIPCPTCGATRGFVLAIHGQASEGWRLSPAGPILAVGLLAAAILFLAMAATPTAASGMRRWVQAAVMAYAAVGATVWIGSWLSVVWKLRVHQ
jgi:hypothetical protein